MGGVTSKRSKAPHDEKEQLIEEVPISPERLKAIAKRQRISQEVVDTERSYSAALDGCVQQVLIPLRTGGPNIPKINKEKLRIIFSNLEALNTMHKAFLEELLALLSQENALFGPLFVNYAETFKTEYSIYVNNYNESLKTLVECENSNPEFEKFIMDAAVKLNGQEISSFLIMPVQRLPRYILLLKDLLANTFPDEPDYTYTKQATETMEGVTKYVNEEKNIAENQLTLMSVQEQLSSCSQLLMSRDRWLISKGPLNILKGKSDSYRYFLFNDIIIITIPNSRGTLSQLSSLVTKKRRKLSEVERAHLSTCVCTDKSNTEAKVYHLLLKTDSNAWTIVFESKIDLDHWLKEFENAKAKCPVKKERKVISYELVIKNEKDKLMPKPRDGACCPCCSIM